MENLEKENNLLKHENANLAEQVMKRTAVQVSQDNCLNDLEQYSRRNSVRIYDFDDRDQKESPRIK